MTEKATLWGLKKEDKIEVVDNNRQYHCGKITEVGKTI
jgi:hypothetical protein